MMKLDPELNVGFLLHDVSRLMRTWFDQRAQALGLTRAQWRVLVHLGPREGINQTSLAEILELDNVTLGRHLDRLERDGWLERRRDPTDRRAWRLYMTDAAQPTLDRMEALALETQAAALAGLSQDDLSRLVETLVKIKGNIAGSAERDEALPEDAAEAPPRAAAG